MLTLKREKVFFYWILGIGDESIGYEPNDGDIDSQDAWKFWI
jgi:hypothetical protein